MKQTSKVLLHLSLINGVGCATVTKILKGLRGSSSANLAEELSLYEQDINALYSCKQSDFVSFGIKENIARDIYIALQDKNILEEEIKLIEKYNIDLITFFDDEYPDSLRQIYVPPVVLYCKGAKLKSFDKNIAVVGARKAGEYAKKVSDKLVGGLVQYGWSIVSGGAKGVDAMAHEAAIEFGGRTIAVLGSGLMEPYPECNKQLFRDIVKSGGCLVSSFPLRMGPRKENFPARNRIISGLSEGCLLVQAAKKSGARITAQFALDQGKSVFAVPGDIHDELSLGCHELIAQGAKITSSLQDILEEFGERESSAICLEKRSEKSSTNKSSEDNSRVENPIFGVLKSAMSLDELCMTLGEDMETLQGKLFDLQLKGLIRQNFAGSWERAL